MVRAGDVPLDRAHAHARWAERYDSQGNTQRAAAHFGRAMHYAQRIQAFGDPKRSLEEADAREADLGDIAVGRWEDGKEVWTTLYSERLAAATKRKRMQQVLRGHGATKADRKGHKGTAEPPGSLHRVLPGMLDSLYASESSGTKDSVHRDTSGSWYIHRDRATSLVYLVPVTLAGDQDGAKFVVSTMRQTEPSYPYALSEGLLIVQDKRPGRVQVKRNGVWEPATSIETFAYYDFLLRYPELFGDYRSEKKASGILASDEPIDSQYTAESIWTTIPLEYLTNKNKNPRITLERDLDRGIYYISNFGPESIAYQISDWAWRAASLSTFEGHSLYADTWPSDIVYYSDPGESGSLYDD
jgi:hypothetical protein